MASSTTSMRSLLQASNWVEVDDAPDIQVLRGYGRYSKANSLESKSRMDISAENAELRTRVVKLDELKKN
ncbi:unnamed protein product [Rhizophagus irregularis]|nr:unnamed protein product [Rhizophagus irregularis]